MSTSNSNFNLELQLKVLAQDHSRCLVYFACNWSGHAQIYRSMLHNICQAMTPKVKFIHQPLNQPPFEDLKSSLTNNATVFLLRDGKIKDTIEGILPHYQIIDRIQFFNTS